MHYSAAMGYFCARFENLRRLTLFFSLLVLPGILSYLADRPPPQYIHPNTINVDSNSALSVPSNPSALDPYQPGGTVGLEPGLVSMDSRSVSAHGAQNLHPAESHEVALDTAISMESVSRVTSPISTDGMAEELTMDDVAGEHSQIPSGSRSHEPLTVEAVGSNLASEAVGHGGVLPIHSSTLDLPVVMEPDHIAGRVTGISDSTLNDSIHTVAMSTNSVSVALSTSHNLASLDSVALHEVGLSLEPVAVSSINQEVAMGPSHVDVSADNLAFVPSSLQMEDSNSNKENMATLFTICECAFAAFLGLGSSRCRCLEGWQGSCCQSHRFLVKETSLFNKSKKNRNIYSGRLTSNS